MNAGHQPQVGNIFQRIKLRVTIEIVHVLLDERYAVIGITVGVGRVARHGVVRLISRHELQLAFHGLALLGVNVVAAPSEPGHDQTFTCLGFLIALRPRSLDTVVPCFSTEIIYR